MIHRRLTLGLFTVVAAAMVVMSCAPASDDDIVYFPVDSLMDVQIHSLLKTGASIRKTSVLDSTRETTDQKPTTIDAWRDELEAFLDLEVINNDTKVRPYRVEAEMSDTRSNLKIRSIVLRNEMDPEEFPVESIKIFYEGTYTNVRRIEAQYRKRHTMYHSLRHVTLEFNEVRGKNMLTAYALRGGQKIFLGDSVSYAMYTKVLFP